MSCLCWGASLIGAPSSGYAQSQPVTLRFTESLMMDARDDNKNINPNDDEYQIAVNRLSIGGQAFGLNFNGRLDTQLYRDPPTDDFRDLWLRLERLSVDYQFKRLKLTAGDLYQQLGRGQVLALRKVDELGVDIALRGGRVTYSDRDHLLNAFGGVSNVVNLDSVSNHFVEDRADLIFGGQYGLRALSWGEVGLLYAFIQPEEQAIDDLDLPDATSSGGLYLDAPALSDWLSLYGEVDLQQRRTIEAVQGGQAGYLMLDWHFADTTVLTEGLWVDNFEQRGSENSALKSRFNYNQGPTLERIDQEVAELYDVRGGRVRVQQYFLEGDLSVHLNALYRRTKPNDPMELDQYHGFGGVERYYDQGRSRFALSGGHRFDQKSGFINRVWSHLEGDYVQRLWGAYAAHLTTQLQRIRVEQQPFFNRGSTVLGIEKSGLGSLSVEWGIDTQNQSEDARQMFYAGILSWDVSRKFLLRSIVGSQRGGIKCVGGVCRNFPAFSGVRLQLIMRHSLNL